MSNNLGPVAPNQLNYSDVLPIAIESKSQKRTFNPTNGVEFGPKKTNVIRLNINSDNLWDTTHSYLQVKLTNTTPVVGHDGVEKVGLDQGLPWLNRLQIMSGGVELENIDAYNRLYALMLQIQGNPEQRHDLSLTHGEAGSSVAITDYTAFNAPITIPQLNANDNAVTGNSIFAALNGVKSDIKKQSGFYHNVGGVVGGQLAGAGAAGSSVIYNVPLMSAILNNPKYFPLIFTNMGLDINLYLEDAINIGIYGAATVPDYEITDVRYHCHFVDVDRTFYDRMKSAMMASGGFLQLSGTTYRHYMDTHEGSSGDHTLQISTRLKSLNALFVRPQKQATTNGLQKYAISAGASVGMKSYQFRIGSMVYPQEPVKVSSNGTLKDSIGEAYSELRKCLGVLGTYDHNSYINADTFKLGGTYADGAGSGALREMFVAAYNFEGFAKTATESGINVADRALNVTCEIARDATITQAIRYDIFAQTDMIIYIAANGEISTTI